MKRIYVVAAAVLITGFVSACDGDNAKKMLKNEGSPFGQLESDSTAKTNPAPKEDQKADADKAKPNGQPFGSME